MFYSSLDYLMNTVDAAYYGHPGPEAHIIRRAIPFNNGRSFAHFFVCSVKLSTYEVVLSQCIFRSYTPVDMTRLLAYSEVYNKREILLCDRNGRFRKIMNFHFPNFNLKSLRINCQYYHRLNFSLKMIRQSL